MENCKNTLKKKLRAKHLAKHVKKVRVEPTVGRCRVGKVGTGNV